MNDKAVGSGGYIYAAWVWTVTIGIGLLAWPAMLLAPKRTRWPLLRLAGKLIANAAGIEVSTEMGEIPRPCLFVANHSSYVDGLALAIALPHPAAFIVGGPIARQRIAGPFMRALGSEFVGPLVQLPVRRQLARLTDRLVAGEDLVGFPEGRLGSGGALQPFHLGLFLVAVQSGANVIPVAITGTAGVVRPHSKRVSRAAIHVRFGEPITTTEGGFGAARALARQTNQALADMLDLNEAPGSPATGGLESPAASLSGDR